VATRRYSSPRRAQQAALTRHAIVDAARQVFNTHGYAAATIPAIAEAADVAVPTVYASVGGKSAILAALQERIDEDSRAADTLAAVRASNDARTILHITVQLAQRIAADFGDIIKVLDTAAAGEPDAAAALHEGMRRHRLGIRSTVERLDALHALRPEQTIETAAETLAVLTFWRTWQTLLADFAWPPAAAAEWVERRAAEALLRAAPK
jgi:AcrR family transcriptional regulator